MISGKQIEDYRKKAGITREALAVEMGVSFQTIWRWEHGFTIPAPAQKALEHLIDGAK